MKTRTIKDGKYTVNYNYLGKITYEQFLEKCFNDYYLKTITDEINIEIEKNKVCNNQ